MLLALVAATAAFDPSQADPATITKLTESGQVVIVEERPDGRVELVTGGTLVKASPDEVWAVITDYEAYPKWMPQTTVVSVTEGPDGTKDVHYTLDFQFSVISKTVEYTNRHWEDPTNRSIRFELVSGDFAASTGSWHVTPAKGGSIVYYSTYTDLESMGWIVASLIEEQPSMEMAIQASTAVMVVKAIKERAES
ncbi:MAG TPA: SRPBCC family protein [Myxococcota bacterium]|nr:SRPBCC family protein [Myxococcota bacterium]